MNPRPSAERLAEIGTQNTPEGRLDLIRQFQSEFPPDVQGYSFLIPEGARGVSLEDYRAAMLGAIPLLLDRITAIRLSLDAVTRERDDVMYVCPRCGFRYGREHWEASDMEDCPACHEQQLRRELAEARRVTDAMVERAAITFAEFAHWSGSWDALPASVQDRFCNIARRAIAAALGVGVGIPPQCLTNQRGA